MLFFLNQQFITWSVKADYGSYFVAMYIPTETTCKNKGKEKWNEIKKKTREHQKRKKSTTQLYYQIQKCYCWTSGRG